MEKQKIADLFIESSKTSETLEKIVFLDKDLININDNIIIDNFRSRFQNFSQVLNLQFDMFDITKDNNVYYFYIEKNNKLVIFYLLNKREIYIFYNYKLNNIITSSISTLISISFYDIVNIFYNDIFYISNNKKYHFSKEAEEIFFKELLIETYKKMNNKIMEEFMMNNISFGYNC